MMAAGMVTTETMTRITVTPSNRLESMKPLAPNTPVNVATVGISTSTTMLSVNDHDRASRISAAPATTTGTEQASAMPAISHMSAVGIPLLAPHVTAAPHRLHPVVIAELRPQPLDVHGDGGEVAEVPLPHPFQQFLSAVDDAGVGEEEQQQIELAVGQADRPALDGRGACGGRDRHVAQRHADRRGADRG